MNRSAFGVDDDRISKADRDPGRRVAGNAVAAGAGVGAATAGGVAIRSAGTARDRRWSADQSTKHAESFRVRDAPADPRFPDSKTGRTYAHGFERDAVHYGRRSKQLARLSSRSAVGAGVLGAAAVGAGIYANRKQKQT